MGGKRKSFKDSKEDDDNYQDDEEAIISKRTCKRMPANSRLQGKQTPEIEEHSQSTIDSVDYFSQQKKDIALNKPPAKISDDSQFNFLKVQEINKPQEIFDCKYKPSQVNFREKEIKEISTFVKKCIKNQIKNKCLLITGMPGCGKTLTSLSVLEEMAASSQIELMKFNAMSYNTQTNFLSDLYLKIFQSQSSSSPAGDILANIHKLDRKSHLVLFIDEFDNLFCGNGQEIFTLFKIVNEQTAISLIGVSNSMEMIFNLSKKNQITLPEIKNIVFQPYSQKEIYSIISSRLQELKNKFQISSETTIIDDKALRVCTGRMYGLKGGDIRCLFEVCKKAIDSECSSKESLKEVSISELNEIIDKLYRAKYDFIADLPTEQQLVVIALYQVLKQNEGIVELPFNKVRTSLNDICQRLAFDLIPPQAIVDILDDLQAYQILLIRRKEQSKKIKNFEGVAIFLKITLSDIEEVVKSQEKFSQFF